MTGTYVIGLDQSTQGTKALLLDGGGKLAARCDKPHEQIINEQGWVSHDLNEILSNVIEVTRLLLEEAEVSPDLVSCIGISNQRETSCMWRRSTGEPMDHAVVWQCSRAKDVEARVMATGRSDEIFQKTGIPLSAYYPACKMAWLLNANREEIDDPDDICLGTIDSWLIFKLTREQAFKTDYSNASRTQLFNIHSLAWDEDLCDLFGLSKSMLPEVCDSDSLFGYTTMDGLFAEPVPICGVLGDSHGALFGQGCHDPGMVKTTYGTGSSVMMNIGEKPITSSNGMATSLAWKMQGRAEYVLEGNLNYTGAVITWLKKDLEMIQTDEETEILAMEANPADRTYLVPAFSGLGAPYWDSEALAMMYGMSRTTGKAELVKAALESIAYQITDLVCAMEQDTNIRIEELRVDGGPTHNSYLMQFQSDLLQKTVALSEYEELSGIGAAYAAGISRGLYDRDELFSSVKRTHYVPKMEQRVRDEKYRGWKSAVNRVLMTGEKENHN
ncbi:MAG: glycerol kinase GlpK [Lachnospiraceae bacterium]|nr:glycerol kinase GlpK [Lachnospiraceae bacterium]